MDKDKFIFNAQISKYDSKVNNGFAKVKIFVDTYEQVANGTKFSKELLLSKMSNLNYLPIVAEFKQDKNDFGTHGGKLELSDEGIEWIDTTRPYGTVIENSGRFEHVTKPNGEQIEYVVCDGYVWIDRYPELNVLFEGKPNNQSMEIHILSGHVGEDDVYYVDDYEYSSLCILGKDITPAFNLAKIEANYEAKDFKEQYTEMLSALEKYLAKETSGEEVVNVEEESNKDEEIFEQTEVTVEEPINYQELYEAKLNEFNNLQENYNELIGRHEILLKEFEEYKNNYSTPNSEVERLKNFESETLVAQRKELEESLFTQFDEKLKGVEEYEELKKNASNYEIDILEKECFIILGKKTANFSTKPTSKREKVKIEFTKTPKSNDEFEELFDKYLSK